MDDVERLHLARQLLRERDDDPPARLAGVLVLLFGQFVTRLCLIELAAITVDDDGRVNIALSDTPLRLREPLAGLALRVADDAREQGSRWLFPAAKATDRYQRADSASASHNSALPRCWEHATARSARSPRNFLLL